MMIQKKVFAGLMGIGAIVSGPQAFSLETVADLNSTKILSATTKKMYGDRLFRPEILAIKVQDSVVTLKGIVPNLRARDRAVALAESVPGVKGVIDEIKMEDSKRSDDQIAHDAVRTLSLDDATRKYHIKTLVNEGFVTLTGKVNSWAERDLVSWVLKGVRGVKGIDNEIELTPHERRPDRDIASDVWEELRLDPDLSDDALTVQVKQGKVSVTGDIANLNQERRIYEEALVRGVTGINLTGLVVRPGGSMSVNKGYQILPDQAVRNALSLNLGKDPRLKDVTVRTRVYEHVATLSGTVGNLKARGVAGDDAKNTRGVAEVINNIQVIPRLVKKDKDIAADVQEALSLDPLLDTTQINLQVEKGVVTLNGKANGLFESWIAADDASRISGVREVKNSINVNLASTKDKSDATVQSDLISSLNAEPDLNFGDHIKVNVKDGKAFLTGEVSSRSQVELATKDALDSGARTVENDLIIPGQKQVITRVYSSMPLEVYSLSDEYLQGSPVQLTKNQDSFSSEVTKISDIDVADRISKKLFNSKNFSPEDIHITAIFIYRSRHTPLLYRRNSFEGCRDSQRQGRFMVGQEFGSLGCCRCKRCGRGEQ